LEVEEARYKQHAAAVADLDRVRAEIEAEGIRAETDVRSQTVVAGSELAALSRFRLRVRAREAEIARQRIECARKLAEQQKVMLEAQRRVKLLERLEERRRAEWKAAHDRELDEIAAESFLANRKDSAITESPARAPGMSASISGPPRGQLAIQSVAQKNVRENRDSFLRHVLTGFSGAAPLIRVF